MTQISVDSYQLPLKVGRQLLESPLLQIRGNWIASLCQTACNSGNGVAVTADRDRSLDGILKAVRLQEGVDGPVSYTHLDVYKRQVLAPGGGAS